ncbi:MAG: VOC family protein [Eubacteriales bacterium]|nr:VOC family protein [Eubacteriales bacterium]MDD3882809.1 VOC family protein [Eubacteriales bacterium]MDD4513293.1 VOC family protein [Eubacteriales bacterium]
MSAHFGNVYFVVRDLNRTTAFYEKLFGQPVSARNRDRFAQFALSGGSIAFLCGNYDSEHTGETEKSGYDEKYDDTAAIAKRENCGKAVINLWTESLQKERERILALKIAEPTEIKYLCSASPYWYFQLSDPDGITIEITGSID